jgi:hypothetical protein
VRGLASSGAQVGSDRLISMLGGGWDTAPGYARAARKGMGWGYAGGRILKVGVAIDDQEFVGTVAWPDG